MTEANVRVAAGADRVTMGRRWKAPTLHRGCTLRVGRTEARNAVSNDEIAHHFDQLSQVAGQLNVESDEIGTIIRRSEERLRALNVGLPACVAMYQTWVRARSGALVCSQQPGEKIPCLGYFKGPAGWALYFTVANFLRKDDTTRLEDQADLLAGAARLADCPRQIRIAALEALPRLLRQLTDEATKAVETIRKAKKLSTNL